MAKKKREKADNGSDIGILPGGLRSTVYREARVREQCVQNVVRVVVTSDKSTNTGVILRDFSPEGSGADCHNCREGVFTARQILRKLRMTPS